MILIAVDTSTRWAGVGLQIGSGDQTEMVWRSDQNHGRELLPAIVELMSRAGLTPADITHLAVALGPGGFSAVRVGISAVMGIALPGGLPIVGIPTHTVEALPHLGSASEASPIISVIPAGRGELSWAQFDSPSGDSTEIGLSTVSEFAESVPSRALVCGEGAELLADTIDGDRILSGDAPTRSPMSILKIAAERFASGDPTPPAELRPIYARPPSISVPRPPR